MSVIISLYFVFLLTLLDQVSVFSQLPRLRQHQKLETDNSFLSGKLVRFNFSTHWRRISTFGFVLTILEINTRYHNWKTIKDTEKETRILYHFKIKFTLAPPNCTLHWTIVYVDFNYPINMLQDKFDIFISPIQTNLNAVEGRET